MPDPLAVSDDVADIWRPLTSAEADQVDNLIVKASAMLRAACPFDIDARIARKKVDPADKNGLDADLVSTVVATVVKRVMVNRDGAISASETIGDVSNSATFGGSAGGLVVLPSDLAMLRPAVGFAAPFTIRTRPRHDPAGRRHPPSW